MTPFPARTERSVRADLVWLTAIVAIALFIRIYFPWALVFAPTHVNLLETDAWYHLRVIENLVRHFPHRLTFDPYALPVGQFVPAPPLFDYVVAGAAWIMGLGHPSEALVRWCVVFAPPVLGALTVVGVYLLGRMAGGSLAGLLAAALAAILPGQFLDRTLLGFADHHALESCVSTFVLCLVAWPLVRPQSVVRSGLWLGAGLVLFRLTWTSSAMLVMVLVAWLVVHVALQSWRRGGAGDAARILGLAALIALPFTWLLSGIEPYRANLHVAALAILATVAMLIEAGRVGLTAGWWTPRRLIVIAITAAMVTLAGFFLLFPMTARAALGDLARFRLTMSNEPVIEAKPLFMFNGEWSWLPAWQLFRSGFVLGLGAVVFLAVRWTRRGQPIDLLLIVWTMAMYAATMGQNRFGYYLVPAMAIVAGCACAWLLEAGTRVGGWKNMVAVVSVAAGAFGVNLVPAIATTVRPAGISSAWFPAVDWLRQHAAEPFTDPNYYFARYDEGTPLQPSSSVITWWDYGYALMALTHRVPTAIPTGGGAVEVAKFFTATDEANANASLDGRERYVFVDELLPFSTDGAGSLIGKFQAMVGWAQAPEARYFASFLVREGGGEKYIFLFFEDYYRSMTYRLGVAGGEAVAATNIAVVSWTVENVANKGPWRVITSLQPFSTYEDASRRLKELGPGNHAIVGRDPRASAVPLEPIRQWRRAFHTPSEGIFKQGAVQIFERRGIQ